MKNLLLVVVLGYSVSICAQSVVYTTSNVHSHNDYAQSLPFWDAYNHGFGSIEADVFCMANNSPLLVGHTLQEVTLRARTLDSLYLIPLVQCVRKNKGKPYADQSKKLQLLIDIKTAAVPTLRKLMQTLQQYPELTACPSIRFVISGNRPSADSFELYPSFITFDGELQTTYTELALKKIALLSSDLKKYTSWNGKDSLAPTDKLKLQTIISQAHHLNKPVRFWDAPDLSMAWITFMKLGVDYINTDKIKDLADFLNAPRSPIQPKKVPVNGRNKKGLSKNT